MTAASPAGRIHGVSRRRNSEDQALQEEGKAPGWLWLVLRAAGEVLMVIAIALFIRLLWAGGETTYWFYAAVAGGGALVLLGTVFHWWALRTKGEAWLTGVYQKATWPVIIILALAMAIPLAVLLLLG